MHTSPTPQRPNAPTPQRPNAPTPQRTQRHQRPTQATAMPATELPALTAWRNAAFDLRREITATAEAIAEARTVYGEQSHSHRRAVARRRGRRAFALLSGHRRRRPRARRRAPDRPPVRSAPPPARASSSSCRTPTTAASFSCCSRRAVRPSSTAADERESSWLNVLLNGLGDRDMAVTTHVLRIIRQRLQRDARELARRKRQR